MHGRVKVKTTAQQAEEKRIERAKRLAMYQGAMNLIFEKRGVVEDDEEVLKISGRVLADSPDDSTLWNIRREIYLKMKEDGRDISTFLKDELFLVQQALMKNPKSYGAWFHRGWTNENLTDAADWKGELNLCNLFLKKDDRNFHCWDYRRFVLRKYPQPLEDELKFSRSIIDTNFSNYSSWHFRSRLLPELYPAKDGDGIEEKVLLEELDLVLNAAFTDPQDQSAWMYHRWLLGKVEPKDNLLLAKWCSGGRNVVIAFEKAQEACSISVSLDTEVTVKTDWKPVGGLGAAYVWESVIDVSQGTSSLRLDSKITLEKDIFWRAAEFSSDLLTTAKTAVLEDQLKNAVLLAEMEPDCKWPLLTSALLMNALSDPQYYKQLIATLDKLPDLDPKRREYYRDLRSKLVLESKLSPIPDKSIDLSGLGLTCLRNGHFMATVEVIDLSGNQLRSDRLNQLRNCPRLRELKLDGNPIENLDFLKYIPGIESLSLSDCKDLNNVDGLKFCLTKPKIVASPAGEISEKLQALSLVG